MCLYITKVAFKKNMPLAASKTARISNKAFYTKATDSIFLVQ